VPFGEARAVLVGQQGGVVVGRQGCVGRKQRREQEKLAKGGADKILAAHHLRDAQRGVIDGAGKLVAGQAVLSPYEKVAEIAPADGGAQAEASIGESHRLAVGHTEAPVARQAGCIERRQGGVGGWTPGGGVEGFVIAGDFVGGGEGAGEIFAGAVAGVDESGFVQTSEGVAVGGQAGGLHDDGLFPRQSKPGEVGEGGCGELRPAARGIEVVHA